MTNHVQRKALITRYVLGQVSAEERAQLEAQYEHDNDLFEEIVATENDIIDEYVRGKLPAAEQIQFEAYFLSDLERRERVELARALINSGLLASVSARGPREQGTRWNRVRMFRRLAVRVAIAAALCIVLVGLVWTGLINWTLRQQLASARVEQASARQQADELRGRLAALERQAAAERNVTELPPPGSVFVSAALASDVARGGGQQTLLHLPPHTAKVFLLVRRDGEERSNYDLVVETAEGRRIWQRNNVDTQPTIGGQLVVVEISPRVLQRGDYVLRLIRTTTSGKPEDTATYSFRVATQ